TLAALIARIATIRRRLPESDARAAAGAIRRLACAPGACAALERALESGWNAIAIAEAVGSDPGLAAKLLQLASTSFFAPARPVETLLSAVERLGAETLRSLIQGHVLAAGPDEPDSEL